MTIAMRHVVKFPADVQATAGVEVIRSGGTYRFKLNYDQLSPSGEVQSAALIAFMDPVTKAMGVTTLSAATNSNANIQSIAETETSADKVGYWNGSASYQLTTFTSFARTLVASDDASAGRSTLGVVIGTDVQAHSANLDAFSGKAAPSGDVVGTSDTQTLTGKTIDGGDNTITNVPNSALNVGTGANQIVALDGTGKLPAIDGSQLTGLPGGGDMLKSSYDPGAINANAFDGYPIANRTTLAGLSTTAFTTAYLRESGREGTFLWNGSNLSTQVTADTGQGDYVPPTADTTGASGAWQRVRKFGDLFKTSEYGDDIAKAMAACSARGGGTVEINKVGSLTVAKGLIKPANVQLVGLGGDKTIIVPTFTSATDFAALTGDGKGTWVIATQDNNNGSMTALPSFTAVGVDEMQVTFASAHGLAVGDELCFYDSADYSFSAYRYYYRRGCRHIVMGVNGLTVYLDTGFLGSYTYSSTVKAYKVNKWEGKFGGFTVDATGVDPTLSSWGVVKVFRAASAEVDDIKVFGTDSSGIEFDQCMNMRPTRTRGASQMDGAADTTHYPLLLTSCSDVVITGGVGRGIWCGGDISGYDTAGGTQSYRSGYDGCEIVNSGTSPAAGVHGNSQECFYRNCKIDGGACLGGLNFTLENNEVRVWRGTNSVLYLGSDVVGGWMNIINCNGRSIKNGGGETPTAMAAVYFRAEASASEEVFFNIQGGSIYAPSETRPVYIETLSTAAPVSYAIEDVNVTLDSCNTDGMVRVLKSAAHATPRFAVQRNIRGFTPAQPWARWDGGYNATQMEMPRNRGTWNDTTSASPGTSQDLTINLQHAYPTGYPVGGSASLLTINLGTKTHADVRDLQVSYIRPFIGTGNDTNLSPSAGFTVAWETW
jgi:hypothetical protein